MSNTKRRSTTSCPIAKTAAVIGDVYVLLIIRDLLVKPRRYNELLHSLRPISSRTLAKKLLFLEDQAFIRRRAFSELPPRVEYSLTQKGRSLKQIMAAMLHYGEQYLELKSAL